MPGAFHTELVKKSDQKFKVFLLDINFGNATTHKSSVEAALTKKGKNSSLVCTPKGKLL
jgi:hypothetical protein